MCYKCRLVNLSINMDDLEPELRRIAQLIYDGKLKPNQIDGAMVRKIAEQLMNGVTKGYGKATTDLDISFIKKLEENIYVFSGFKNYQQLKETSLLLLDNEGSYKSFNEFFTAVRQINETYNEVYLESEYNTAIASAQSASTWNDYENNGITMLRYTTVGDERVRDEHAILDGITLPIDDPFWNTFYPPNDWNCRCDTEPAVGEEPIGRVASELPVLKPMFSGNVAKDGVIFPDTHPYFDVSKEVAKQIINQVDDFMPKESERFTPINMPFYEKSLDIKLNSEIFTYLNKETMFEIPKAGKQGAYYLPSKNKVVIPIDARRRASKWGAENVVYHEFGHAIDYQHGLQKAQEVIDIMDNARKKYRGKMREIEMQLHELRAKAITRDEIEKIGSVADTLMSLNPSYGWGHTKAYFKKPGMKEAEFLAHTFENKFGGNDVFKKVMPDLYEDMIKLVDELFKLKKPMK